MLFYPYNTLPKRDDIVEHQCSLAAYFRGGSESTMSGGGERIVRNSLYGIVGQVVGGGIIFLVVLLSARYLGPSEFGVFSFSFAIVAVIHMFAGGLTNILVREIARDLNSLHQVLGAVIPLMAIISVLTVLAVFACVNLLEVGTKTANTIYILVGTLPISFLSAVHTAVCRAHEEMEFNALALIIQRVTLLCSVLVIIYLDAGLLGIAFSYLVAYVIQWFFYTTLVRRRYCRYRWRVDIAYWLYLLREGIPMAFGMMLQRISSYAGVFALTLLSTASAVGLYSSAYRLIEMLAIIPYTLSHPLFPALSRLAETSTDAAFDLYLQAQKYLILMALPLGLWVCLFAPLLMSLLLGPQYEAAAGTLRILGLVVILSFLNSLFLYMYSAVGAQRQYTIIMSLTLVIHVILALVFIPLFDFNGAALAALISECLLWLIATLLLRTRGFRPSRLMKHWPVIPAILLSGLPLLWPLKDPSLATLVPSSLLAGIVYLAAIYKFDLVTEAEIKTLLASRSRGSGLAQRAGDNPV